MKKRITAHVSVTVDTGRRTEEGAPIGLTVPPGTEIVLDAEEADRIIARHGGEVLEDIADEASQVTKFRRR